MPDGEYWREYRRKKGEGHREKERERSAKRYEELREWLNSLKHAVGCQICGEDYPLALDFHHEDEKALQISHGAVFLKKERIFKAMAQTHLLCCVCHRKVHGGVVSVDGLERVDFAAVAESMELVHFERKTRPGGRKRQCP